MYGSVAQCARKAYQNECSACDGKHLDNQERLSLRYGRNWEREQPQEPRIMDLKMRPPLTPFEARAVPQVDRQLQERTEVSAVSQRVKLVEI
jgi:hypothetical protein